MLDRCRTSTPVWCVAFSFVLTAILARWVSRVDPGFHYNIGGIHIHHYMYGIFMITVAGYLALVFKGPKATFWIALLYGWGAGFTFDEMGMWLNASVSGRFRWDGKGLIIGLFTLTLVAMLSIGLKRLKTYQTETKNRLNESTIDVLAVQPED